MTVATSEGDEEGRPGGAADLARDLAGEGVDAGAEDVADDEEEEELRAHDPDEAVMPPRSAVSGSVDRCLAHAALPDFRDASIAHLTPCASRACRDAAGEGWHRAPVAGASGGRI